MIAVVGGGVIGMAVAYFLGAAGNEVTIYDRDTFGNGCTSGSAGWITPSESAPVVGPAAIRAVLGSLGRKSSPLYIKPGFDLDLYLWLARAALYCNRRSAEHGFRSVVELSKSTFDLFNELSVAGLDSMVKHDGLLHVFNDARVAADSLSAAQAMVPYGYRVPTSLLAGRELHEVEPTLSSHATTGYLIEEECHVDPAHLVETLKVLLEKVGVLNREHEEIQRIVTSSGRVIMLETTSESVKVETLVVAGGVESRNLLKLVGVSLPMTAGKGYSFLHRLHTLPKRPVHLGDAKVALTPLERGLRVAGTMELSGDNMRIRYEGVAAIERNASRYFSDWNEIYRSGLPDAQDFEELWVGRRPLTPDGLPILDRVDPFTNLFLATGHSMLGITLSLSSGKALSEFIISGKRPMVLDPFQLRRFRFPKNR